VSRGRRVSRASASRTSRVGVAFPALSRRATKFTSKLINFVSRQAPHHLGDKALDIDTIWDQSTFKENASLALSYPVAPEQIRGDDGKKPRPQNAASRQPVLPTRQIRAAMRQSAFSRH
jgi:hypothetical protein